MRINRRIRISILILGLEFAIALPTLAQNITLDGTLGEAKTLTGPNYTIRQEDGQTVGNNLFHSFGRFGLDAKEAAIFQSNPNIQNILSRVTGGFPSFIDGLIKAESASVNLFLINPSGITFGANASLNVSGSFVATSANAIQFGDKGFFSATDPNSPALLTVNPSALFFNQIQAGQIKNQSIALAGEAFGTEIFGLRVPDGKSLLLVGGDIVINGGGIYALEGRIELASVKGSGTVGLDISSSGELSLSFPEGLQAADILLTNEALVDVSGEGGGAIQIWGRRVSLSNDSVIGTTTLGMKNGRDVSITARELLVQDGAVIGNSSLGEGSAGNLIINASESVKVIGTSADGGGSLLFNQALGIGNGGDLSITTRQLLVQDGAMVSAKTVGEGAAGNLIVNASESVEVDDTRTNPRSPTGLFSGSENEGKGSAGNLIINTEQLLVKNGAQISTTTVGEGAAGNLTINASQSVQVVGTLIVGDNEFPAGLFSETDGKGNAGDLTINTRQLLVQDGATISTTTRGKGLGGNLTVNASESVYVIGTSPNNSRLFSDLLAQTLGQGNGGNLTITTTRLLIQNGGEISSGSTSKGNAGNLTINAFEAVQVIDNRANTPFLSSLLTQAQGQGDGGDLIISTKQLQILGGLITTGTTEEGTAGNLRVDATESVQLIAASTNSSVPTLLTTQTLGKGNAGNLTITTGQLLLQNGAQISTNTIDEGTAGRLTVNASESIQIIGISASNQIGSQLSTVTVGKGNAGDMIITTRQLLLQDGGKLSAGTSGGNAGSITVIADTLEATNGGQILTTTLGSENAGDINLKVQDSIIFAGLDSGIFANTSSESTGIGGNISLNTQQLTIQNGATITASSEGTGNAGNILNITARNLTLDNGSIATTSISGNGGNIENLQVQDLLLLRNQSQISTTAGTEQSGGGNGGNININAGFIVAVPDENSDITANAFAGSGGNITITTNGIFGLTFRNQPTLQSDITASSRFGINGIIAINTPDVNPLSALDTLPINPVDAERLVAQNVCAIKDSKIASGSSFVITGKGGLPPNPNETLTNLTGIVQWATNDRSQTRIETPVIIRSRSQTHQPEPITPIQGWVKNSDGTITLTTTAPTVTPQSPSFTPQDCRTAS